MPNCAAIWGSALADLATAAFRSSGTGSGTLTATTELRTGENAIASSTATHRSVVAVAFNAAPAVSLSRLASGAGNLAPAFGGRVLNRRARMIRDSSNAVPISSSQAECSFSTRVVNASRSCAAIARDSSSRAASSAPTTERRSRRSISSTSASAASARSRHSAERTCGSICSARPIKLFDETSGLPSALSASFCVAMA